MEIHEGLFSKMVLQRNAKNVSEAVFSGTAAATGKLFISAKQGQRTVKGVDDVEAGRASNGKVKGVLRGLPAGGPYDLELTIQRKDKVLERLKIKDVLVGDVWVLGGQSNMQGIGLLADALKPNPKVRAFYMNDTWRVAKDPIHTLWEAVDPVHPQYMGGKQPPPVKQFTGVGPGLSFGQAMLRRRKVPQGLIACAHGGTSMTQWDPSRKNLDGTSLYGATLRRVKKNGGRIAGIAWYQGESDANPDAAPKYTQRMKDLIANFRRDFRAPELPFVAVQIGRFTTCNGAAAAWNSVQDQQRLLPKFVKNMATVPAIDLGLDDSIHIGGKDQNVLGERIAEAMEFLTRGHKAGTPPIELRSLTVERNPRNNCGEIVAEFANVVGGLTSDGPAKGFVVADNQNVGMVYRVEVAGNKARLRTNLTMVDLGTKLVHYGHGYDPVCNITDRGGRSLPVFGPIAVGRPRAATPFIQHLEVSGLLPSAGKLEGLAYPQDKSALRLERRKFDQNFCNRHPELSARAPEDVLVYYRAEFDCAEPMKLVTNIGYDGPLKVWLDGREIFHDPDGINPALPDDARLKFDSPGGKHELLVALGSNCGQAWGIFLHFQRTDVTVKQIQEVPRRFAMPVVSNGA